jgi:hypothetical protein
MKFMPGTCPVYGIHNVKQVSESAFWHDPIFFIFLTYIPFTTLHDIHIGRDPNPKTFGLGPSCLMEIFILLTIIDNSFV